VFQRKRCRRQRRIGRGPAHIRDGQGDPHAPPSAARRSSQARSHRRHSSADRRQCSW
jgi:hypothetical protein